MSKVYEVCRRFGKTRTITALLLNDLIITKDDILKNKITEDFLQFAFEMDNEEKNE